MSSQSWISSFSALPSDQKRVAWENLTDEQKWQLQQRYNEQTPSAEKRKNSKWLVHDGPVKGIVRRKKEKDPKNYGIYFDDALVDKLPEKWRDKPDEAPELSGKRFCCFM